MPRDTNKPCIVDGCNRPQKTKWMCGTHYERMRLKGTVLPSRRESGSGEIISGGYVRMQRMGVKKLEHVLVAEAALGRALPNGAAVHHVNGIRHDNRAENLVICPSKEYHALLHVRERALNACGDANKRKCKICGTYEDPARMKACPHKGRNPQYRCKSHAAH